MYWKDGREFVFKQMGLFFQTNSCDSSQKSITSIFCFEIDQIIFDFHFFCHLPEMNDRTFFRKNVTFFMNLCGHRISSFSQPLAVHSGWYVNVWGLQIKPWKERWMWEDCWPWISEGRAAAESTRAIVRIPSSCVLLYHSFVLCFFFF